MKIRIKRPPPIVPINAVNLSNNNKNDKVVMEIKDANVAIESIPQPQATEKEGKTRDIAKTKKKKQQLSFVDKERLWDIFDTDKKHLEETYQPSTEKRIECLYSSEQDLCNLCSSPLMVMDIGFPTCTNTECGVIYKDSLDYSPEWRFYGTEDKNAKDPARCGNPINPLLVESSFGCKVLCSTGSSYEMKKIRKWTEWQSMPHKEKSLYDEFQFITIMAQNAGIPKIFIDDAMAIHKDFSEQKMFRGINRDGIKAASIYISCRLNGCPRTAHEIAEVFKLDKTSATTGCSMAVNILHNIERNVEPENQTELCVTMPSSFIDRYCSRLNFNQELSMLAKFIANKIEKNNFISDNIPHAIASGIVYFVAANCNLNINKHDIKNMCGVSEVTINKCYKKLETIKTELIPKCILDKYR
jgi:transcription initiation factor TFIIB